MEINPIYKFMKDNGLTQKDEATFVSEYSNPQKSAELHKFMVDNGLTTKGADDFYSEYFAGSKKKEPTTPDSSQPAKPSTQSFGQKITEKIASSATQIPLKTTLQQQQEKEKLGAEIVTEFAKGVGKKEEERKQAYEQGGYAYEKFKEKEAVEGERIAKAKEENRKNDQAKTFVSHVVDKDVSQEPNREEAQGYASNIAYDYVDFLANTDPDRGLFLKDKYSKLKSLSPSDRDAEDERFLRQIESDALDITYRAKNQELSLAAANIDKLQKTAVTPSDISQLNYLYKKYERTKNSLNGIISTYNQNKQQYGDLIGMEMQSQAVKAERFKALQEGDAKTIEFFKGIGNAATNGIISLAQLPKVFGDLIGDTDYDWSDEMYDSISNTKKNVDIFFGNPLPEGKSMSDLPTAARIAVIGGNAIGSVGLFATGAGVVGATSNLGKAAATFGTSFLTTEADYYQESLDAGMSPQDAAIAGTYLAAQTALIESIIPDIKYFEPSAFRKSVTQGLTAGIKSGLPAKEAAKLAFKNAIKAVPASAGSIIKSGTKEAGEEILGQSAEDIGKEVINASSQREYFNDTFNAESYVDAIIGGFVSGGGLSVLSRPTPKSPIQESVIRDVVENRDRLFAQGTDTDRKVTPEGKKEVEDAGEILDAMKAHSGWNQMSREEQDHAFALAQQAEVMKKEQERMKELRIPDERKDAEIKRLEDEVNEMFSIQLEQEKQKAKDAKLKAIEDEFNKSMEGEEFPVQEDERDQEIVELQKQREERGINELDTFLSDMKPMVPFAVERTEQGLPVAQSVKQAASNYLYKKYKELTDMKSDPNRMMTRQQIASVQKQLEQDIRTLEGTAETKTETRDQENIPGIPSQVREGQEPIQAQPVEVPSAEAPEAGRVLQAQEEVTPEAAPEVVVKPSRRERLAKMFETSEGEIAAEKVASFLGDANIGVEVLDPKSFEETGKQRNFEGDADGIFLVDNNTGKIYLNKERIKGAEGKTIAFHEGIHPVVNIIRNTNPKLYSAIVDGLKAEAVKNAGVAQAAADVAASEYYQEQGPSAIEDETVVETMARVAAGDIDVDTFEPSFREKFIEFMNKLAKMLGLKPIAVNSPRMEVKRLADQLSKALNEGGKISDIVGKENVMRYENNLAQESGTIETGSVVYAGQASAKIKRGSKIKNPYRESVDLPVRTLESLLEEYGDNVIVVNSDPTGLGTVRLPSGKVIELDGGIGYMSIQENIDAGVGFAASSDARVKFLYKTANQMNEDGKLKNGKVLVLVMVQKADSMLGNNYTPDYVADALAKIPQDVISKEKLTALLVDPLKKETFKSLFYKEAKIPKMDEYKYDDKKTPEENKKLEAKHIKKYNDQVKEIVKANKKKKAEGLAKVNAIEKEIKAIDPRTAHDDMVRIFHELSFVQAQKYFDNILGSYTNKTTKYGLEISRLLYEYAGADQRNLFQVLGEKSLVDQLLQDPKSWGYAVAAFVHNTAKQTEKLGGIKHNLFNAKFQGDERYILEEAYKVNDILPEFNEQQIKKVEEGGKKGAVFAEQQASQGMYPSGKAVVPAKGVGFESLKKTGGRFQPSKGIKRGSNLVKDTYYESGLTEDKNDYIFFHVSSAPEASIRKGIDSTKYTSLRTAREEKGLQYGVASYYTRPEDGERMVGGEKYAVRVPKAKVYPIDSDPLGYGEKAETKIPEGTPFRGEAVKREIADMAKKNGYEMIVGEWSYSRTGKPAGELPEFRADALVPLKPTKEKPDSFTSNAEKGMERIPFPGQQSEQAKQELESIASEVRDIMSSKKKFSSKEYQLADSVYMSGQVTENKYEDNEFKRDITPEEYDMMTKVLPKSMQADAVRVRGLLFGKKGQASIRIPRNVKQFSDNVSETIDRIKTATSEDGATLNLDGSTYEDGGLVVPAGSINVAQDDVSAEGLFEFLKDNEGNISSDIFKIGLYKFPDRPEVSYDLNIVIPREYRDVALKFGELAGQESLFDLDTFENIKTGSDGKNPRKFTAQELAEIAKDLSEGRLPKIVSKQGQPSMVKRTPINWEKSPEGKGDPSISSRNPVVTAAAQSLKDGKITNEEYRATVSENSPILPITRFFEPANVQEIKNAFEVASKKESDAEKIDAPVAEGTVVGLRLDIPSYKSNNTWVVSVHDGNTTGGKVISYSNVAKIKDVEFSVTPKGALGIAAGVAKTTIGRMYGKWENIPGTNMEEKGENAKKMVESIVNDPSYVQVGMNPFRHSYFYDRSSDIGRPIMSAEEVVQIGGLVYAKNPVYGNWTDEAFEVKGMLDSSGKTVQFSGDIKRTPAQTQKLMEDSMDSVDEAIADGVDARTAVEDNITSQDWYGELTPKQKEQFDEIIKDEFGVTPKAPVAKPIGVKATIANIIDNYYKLKDGDRSARAAINEILGQDPKLKYIYDNISKINKQLQDAGVITDKTDGCP